MTRLPSLLGTAALVGISSSGVALAAPALRVQVDQHWDFLLIGNTMGYECGAEIPLPTHSALGTNACGQGAYVDDTSPDLFWRSDAPAPGETLADLAFTPAEARTTAMLVVPPGATITHAYLYWAAKTPNGGGGTQVTLDRPGTGGFQQTIAAETVHLASWGNAYESVTNVTALVRQYGAGTYRVSGMTMAPFANVSDNTLFGAWALVAFYERPADPLRNLALFDGMDVVSSGNNQSVTLSGFVVPSAGFDGKLGVITYEGDSSMTGDQLFFGNLSVPLTDAHNPADNFFNATRSWLGSAVSTPGDMPQLSGAINSMAGFDLDVVDITSRLSPQQVSAPVEARTDQDQYYLGAFITSVTTFRPDFTTSTKAVRDINGGSLFAGETLEYTLTLRNTGNDAAVRAKVSDPLPEHVTYVPGSLRVGSGVNAVAKTDAPGDDQGEYDGATRTVTVRLGTGADETQGGAIPINGTVEVSFQVTVDLNYTGNISNQATVSAGGLLGAPEGHTVTDGDGLEAGQQPIVIVVDECDGTNAKCQAPKPVCKTSVSPKVCVACLVDTDCGTNNGRVCANEQCVDGCRGANGNKCSSGKVCTSTTTDVGSCVACLVDTDCGAETSGRVCALGASDAGGPTCIDGCRGTGGNRCASPATCSSTDATIGVCYQCVQDSTCGGPTSGKVCNLTTHTCIDGCRGSGGNGCAADATCSSTDTTIGQCSPTGDGGADGGDASDAGDGGDGSDGGDASDAGDAMAGYDGSREGGAAGSPGTGTNRDASGVPRPEGGFGGEGGPTWNDVVAQGNGVSCNTTSGQGGEGWLAGMLLAAYAGLRRRKNRADVRRQP